MRVRPRSTDCCARRATSRWCSSPPNIGPFAPRSCGCGCPTSPTCGRHSTKSSASTKRIDQALAESVATFTERTEKTRDMFIAILGHDLRAPLATMTTAGHLLGHPRISPDRAADLGTRISRGASLMSSMVDDLADYTRTQLGSGLAPHSPASGPARHLHLGIGRWEVAASGSRLRLHRGRRLAGLLRRRSPASAADQSSGQRSSARAQGDSRSSMRARRTGEDVIVAVTNHGPVNSSRLLEGDLPADGPAVTGSRPAHVRVEHGPGVVHCADDRGGARRRHFGRFGGGRRHDVHRAPTGAARAARAPGVRRRISAAFRLSRPDSAIRGCTGRARRPRQTLPVSKPLHQQHHAGNEDQRRQGLRHRLPEPQATEPGKRRDQQQHDQQLPELDPEVEPQQ